MISHVNLQISFQILRYNCELCRKDLYAGDPGSLHLGISGGGEARMVLGGVQGELPEADVLHCVLFDSTMVDAMYKAQRGITRV